MGISKCDEENDKKFGGKNSMKIYRDNGNYRMRDGWRLTAINGGN